MEPFFAAATYDELWLLRHGAATLTERRISRGQSLTLDGTPLRIVASDHIEDSALADELMGSAAGEAERAMEALHAVTSHLPARIRTIADVRRVGAQARVSTSLSITIPYAGTKLSLVSTPERAASDLERLLTLAESPPEREVDWRQSPILWRDGTGAVLFHEAIGHPAEHEQAALAWPSWLIVRDEPAFSAFHAFECDDVGLPVGAGVLTSGETPRAQRRGTFRDAPLRRMTNLVVACEGAPLELPDSRIEVLLLAGGAYDPFTGMVTLQIAVGEVVTPRGRRRLAPFEILASRTDVAAHVVGGGGAVALYPGVVCSSEGQELVVGSASPDILTSEFAR